MSHKKKNPKSNRGKGKGIKLPKGFMSPHDLRCLEIQGCDMEKLCKLLGDN